MNSTCMCQFCKILSLSGRCGFIAGFAGAMASNPIDVIKTRLMNQRMLKSGASKVYKGSVDCALQVGCIMPNITLRNENLMA
jgi:hypothetical protein